MFSIILRPHAVGILLGYIMARIRELIVHHIRPSGTLNEIEERYCPL